MSLNKKLSTLVIVVCILYICLVSVLHIGLQAKNWTTSDRYDLHQILINVNDLQHQELQTLTRRAQQNPFNNKTLHHNSLARNIVQTHQHKQDQQISDQIVKSSAINANALDEDNPQESRPLTMRKLKEKNIQQTSDLKNIQQTSDLTNVQQTALSHQHTTTLNNDALKRQTVSQTQVDFLRINDYYIYSIFLDTRFSDDDYLRFLVMRPTFNITTQLVCIFHNAQNRKISVKAERYEMCENHGKKYGGWIYSCRMPRSKRSHLQTFSLMVATETWPVLESLEHVQLQSLTTVTKYDQKLNNHSDNSLNNVKLASMQNDKINKSSVKNSSPKTRLHKDNEIKKLGVCVPPLHGDICLTKIINFIEMCRLLGADSIFLYVHNIAKDIQKFLEKYTGPDPGILNLVMWNLPDLNNTTDNSEMNQQLWNHGQLLAVQHCLYTNMPQFDWLLFIDIDEMLIPQITNTWPDLLTMVSSNYFTQVQSTSIAGISFESAFFQHDFQTLDITSINYFQYLYRTKSTSTQRSKLFVQPKNVFEMGIHHLSKLVSTNLSQIKLGSQHALLHHYRECVPDGNNLLCEIWTKDETILKYEYNMSIASHEVIASAMEFFAHYT